MNRRILVTGASGFIGAGVANALRDVGFDVLAMARHTVPGVAGVATDLLDPAATARALAAAGPFETVVHLAALAHGQRPPPGETARSVNVRMLRSLLDGMPMPTPHWVFASSVAVYGEAGRGPEYRLGDELHPATGYGEGKVEAERLLLRSIPDVDIVRLAPVFDPDHLSDVAKRVRLPGTRVRMRLRPSPRYSLCRVESAVGRVVEIVRRGRDGRWLHQVAQPEPYRQAELLEWFTGPCLPVPIVLTVPLRWISELLPGRGGYAIRCLLAKLFGSTLYPPGSMRIPGDVV